MLIWLKDEDKQRIFDKEDKANDTWKQQGPKQAEKTFQQHPA